MKKLPVQLEMLAERIEIILKWLINISIAWGQKYGQFLIHKNFMAMVATCLRYFDTYLSKFREEEEYKENDQIIREKQEKSDAYDNLILFCVIWSIGGAMEEKSRRQFDLFLKNLVHGDAEVPQKY